MKIYLAVITLILLSACQYSQNQEEDDDLICEKVGGCKMPESPKGMNGTMPINAKY